MPTRPIGPCAHPGCPNRATHRGRCAAHARQREQQRGSASERGYGYGWRVARAEFLKRHPTCEACGARATQVHHVVRLKMGGHQDSGNLLALCATCHSRETATVDTNRSYERRG